MKGKLKNSIVLILVLTMSLTSSTSADLVAYYPFDDGTAVNVGGSAGSAANGDLMGGAKIVSDPGGGFKAASRVLKLYGSPQHVNCGGGKKAGEPETWADLAGPMTVAVWIKADSANWRAGLSTVISKSNGEYGTGGFSLNRKHNSANIAFAVAAPGGLPYDGLEGTNANMWDGEWHHVAGVYSTIDSPDANGVWIYIDGVESGYIKRWSEPVKLNNFDVIIGGNAQYLEKRMRYWRGLIDDVAIFDRALSANEIYQLYTQGALSTDPVLQKLIDTIQEAEAIAKKQGHQEARAFLEERIAEYEKWKKENPNDSNFPYNIMASDLYVLLAKTNIQNLDNVQDTYGNIRKQAKSRGNWAAFKLFLDIVFSKAKDTTSSAKSVEPGLSKDSAWAKNYFNYCKGKSELIRYLVEKDSVVAEEYIAKEEYKKAAEIYRDIIKRYDSDQHQSELELKVCECIFNSGEYQSAISELDRFIAKSKVTNRRLAKKAMLMKGRCYIQLSEISRASDEFFALITEYPEAKEAPDANFFIGYCHMLQKRFEQAIEAFDVVVQKHPDSSYANRARMCMMRIKSTTEQSGPG